MTISILPRTAQSTTDYREGEARHRVRAADLWTQERQHETRARGQQPRHRMGDYPVSELRENRRVDAAQHRACRGEDATAS